MKGQLLDRAVFHREVMARSHGRCVVCGDVAVDPHHIMDRKLFPDLGYYLDNGAAVCPLHHWDCETTVLSVEEVRAAAGVSCVVLPPGQSDGRRYDKWGNVVRADGLREPGPLANDTGSRKALAAGGKLGLFVPAVPAGTPLSNGSTIF